MKLQINNNKTYHLEIIESLIVKHKEIVSNQCDSIILNLHPSSDSSFIKYITKKYNNVSVGDTYANYHIHVSYYKEDFKNTEYFNKNHFFIFHNFDEKTKTNDNIFYLSPLAGKSYFKPNILPDCEKVKTKIPVYAIQGNMTTKRRNFSLAMNILENTKHLAYEMRFIGRESLPDDIAKFEKVKHFADLSFTDFHKSFSDVYCILPLTTKKSHPEYYKSKLTSSVSYIQGYNFPCIIDSDLQSIYHLDNAYVFKTKEDIIDEFVKSYKDFYEQ